MTAEVAVLNKLAVALATDSAVTIGSTQGPKIYNTANKLFALSCHAPVGTMIYGNADFMGVPWETIIKVYRQSLGATKFPTLREYSEHFLRFLDAHNPMFTGTRQDEHFRKSIIGYMSYLKALIDEKVRETINSDCSVDETKIKKITTAVIHKEHRDLQKCAPLASAPQNHEAEVVGHYIDMIKKIRDDVFQKLPISAKSYAELEASCGLLFSRDFFPPHLLSGVVIAGFGEDEVFPSLLSLSMEAVLCDKLKYKENQSVSIGPDGEACIVPFAQSEMVCSFMEGIDPALRDFVTAYLGEVLKGAPGLVADALQLTDKDQHEKVAKSIKRVVSVALTDFDKHLQDRQNEAYVGPILSAVAVLPKDELAEMAESLVSLTSFKRRVSMQDETVGGPVDVAIISKGDGLIWIRRKHYFQPELNPHYFARYQPGRNSNEH